jgi:hypothetical protein
MQDEEWCFRLARLNWRAWLALFFGVYIGGLGACGYTFPRFTNFKAPPVIWLDHPSWDHVNLGVLLIALALFLFYRGRTRRR